MLGSDYGFFSRQLFPLRVAVLAFATCVVMFSLKAAHSSLYTCVRALGGMSHEVRPQFALEVVFWTLTDVPETWSLSVLARHPAVTQRRLAAVNAVVFSSAAITMFTENFAIWIIALFVCCAASAYISFLIVRTLLAVRQQSKNEFTRRLTLVAIPLLNAVWLAFPLLWFLGQFSLISPVTELASWTYLGFIAKLTLGSTLMFGSFFERKREAEEQIEAFATRNREAEAKRLLT
jgi:bacteriorhodopsin